MTTQVHLQLNDQIVDRLRELAAREKRSLTRQCEVLFDEALAARAAIESAETNAALMPMIERGAPKSKAGKA